MDYAYFSAAQQPYHHFVGMPSNPFPHSAVDPDTIGSVEPLDPTLFPASYDAFTFHGLPTPQQGSPDAAVAQTPMPVGSLDSGFGGELDDGRTSRTRSSSEEKESLTPAQSRRKAQNRAAQRAFRERKERHVRDLETKLSSLESSTHSLQSDNERLKLALQRAKTENEILRATSGQSPAASRPVSVSYPSPGAHLPLEEDGKDDDYHVQSLINGSVVNAADGEHAASRRKTRGREIPAAQAWDFIQSHPLVKQGLVDIADVCERLKGAAKCDGHGPVFDEYTILQAIEESRRCGGDELI
ncbi:Nn.00g038650.m01.CDS01 [Neocucurbitaria sp. VM-36]